MIALKRLSWFCTLFSLLVAGAFSWSATFHLTNLYHFLEVVLPYEILRPSHATLLAAALPFLQLTLAVGLVIPWCRREALCGSLAMLAAFAVAQIIVIFKQKEIACGCFPIFTTSAGWQSLGISSILIFMATVGLSLNWTENHGRIPRTMSSDESESSLKASEGRSSSGFTLVELLVVIATLGLLLALLLPAVAAVRESSRTTQCQSRVRQIAIAAHVYMSTRQHLPAGTLGFADCYPYEGNYQNPESERYWGRSQYTSSLALCLPYLEEHALAELLEPVMYDPMRKLADLKNPASGVPKYSSLVEVSNFITFASRQMSLFRCPSDTFDNADIEFAVGALQSVYHPADNLPAMAWKDLLEEQPADYGITNYTGCAGVHSGARHKESELNKTRGLMTSRERMTSAKCLDGMSRTIMYGESIGGIDSGKRHTVQIWAFAALSRGQQRREDPETSQLLGDANYSRFLAFGALHRHGVNFAYGDCRVDFLSRKIDFHVFFTMCGVADGL